MRFFTFLYLLTALITIFRSGSQQISISSSQLSGVKIQLPNLESAAWKFNQYISQSHFTALIIDVPDNQEPSQSPVVKNNQINTAIAVPTIKPVEISRNLGLLPPLSILPPKPPILNPQAPTTPSITSVPNHAPIIPPFFAIPPIPLPPLPPKPPDVTYSFTCPRLPTNFTKYDTCWGVANYTHGFYLPVGSTLHDLELQARQLLGNITMQVDRACLSAVKKLVCAIAYRPCVPGAISGDSSTYSHSTGLPYMKPCQYLCTNIPPICSYSVAVLLGDKVVPYNCNALDTSASYLEPLYDTSNNPDQCNALLNIYNQIVVSAQMEPYRGHLCRGISHNVTIPDGKQVNASYAPLMEAHRVQAIIEDILNSIQSHIPCSFSYGCQRAQRILFCSIAYMPPRLETVSIGPITASAYAPSFPYYGLSLDFNCSGATQNLRNGGSVTVVHRFPKHSQVVGVAGPKDISTPPNYALDTDFNVSVACPRGFSYVTDPNAPGQVMITDVCAVNCPSPVYTQEEQDAQNTGLAATSWICMILGFIQLVNLKTQHRIRRNKLITVIVVAALMGYTYDAFQRAVVTNPDKLICASETQWHTAPVGQTSPETGQNQVLANSCNFYALLTIYTEFAIYWCALAVFIELWLHVILNVKKLPKWRKILFFAGFAVFMMNAVIVNTYGNPVMVLPGSFLTVCNYTTGDFNLDFLLRYLPHLITYTIAMCLGAHVMVVCAEKTARVGFKNENNPLVRLWQRNSILFYYLTVFAIGYGPGVVWLGYYINVALAPLVLQSFIDWTTCVFQNFVTPEDQALVDATCGIVPGFRLTTNVTLVLILAKLFYNIAMVLVTLDRESLDFWNIVFTAVWDGLHCRPIQFKVQIEGELLPEDEILELEKPDESGRTYFGGPLTPSPRHQSPPGDRGSHQNTHASQRVNYSIYGDSKEGSEMLESPSTSAQGQGPGLGPGQRNYSQLGLAATLKMDDMHGQSSRPSILASRDRGKTRESHVYSIPTAVSISLAEQQSQQHGVQSNDSNGSVFAHSWGLPVSSIDEGDEEMVDRQLSRSPPVKEYF